VRFLLVIFIVIPIIEMWLLIQVGGLIGALPTIALVMLTAVIGLALLRRQGFSTLMRGRAKMESGEIPAMEMIEALVLAVSGAMLLTPGFFTDALGFAGLLPLSRHWLVNRLVSRMDIVDGYYQASHSQTQTHSIHGGVFDSTESESGRSNGKETLEGEYRRED
jgi:UPF0716 protein FxsA